MAFSNANFLPESASTFEGGTHSWVDPVNTTLAVVSGQFLSGTQSLRFTATAAGSVQASSPYVTSGVTPGQTYVARIPVRVNQDAPGKSFTARIWFYTSTGSPIQSFSSTINVTSSALGWQSANHPVVSAVAPANAAQMRVMFIATNLIAGEFVNIDDVVLTSVDRRAGDFLDFNTSSIESNTSGWAATNATLSRTSGTLATGAGYYCLVANSQAAGDVDIRTAALYSGMIAGREYVAYSAVQVSVPLTVIFELRWYNASDALIATESRTEALPSGSVVRMAVSGTAPANATKARLALRPQATAFGQFTYVDDVSLCQAPGPIDNLLKFEEFSTESLLPAWTVNDATRARAYLTSLLTEGFYAQRITPTASVVITAQLDRLVPVTAGTTYKVAAVVLRHNPGTEATTSAVRTRVDWYDSAGVIYSADEPDQFYPAEASDTYYAHVVSETRTAPEGAAFARIGVEIDHTASLSDYYMVDNVTFTEAESEYQLIADSETGSVTLTVQLWPGDQFDRITVRRMDQDGNSSELRGYGGAYESIPYTRSVVVIEDYEAPLASRVWYSVKWESTTYPGETARLFTRTIVAPTLEDGDFAWFKSPGNPALNTKVLMEAPIKWTRAARSARYDIVGRKNPIHVSSVRSGRSASVTLLVWDESSNALFDSLLDNGQPALIQAMPGYGVEGNVYLAIGDVEVAPLGPDARQHGWRWTLDVTEVDRPAGGLQGSALSTWQDVYDDYATWEDLFEAHDSWSSVLTKG